MPAGSKLTWRRWSSTTGPAPSSSAAATTRRTHAGPSRCSRDGTTRTLRPRHVVMATGVSGIPSIPDIPSLHNFAGTVLHSSQYEDGEAWNGKRALVIGTGNSGHDIAQDLHASGAQVTLVQRSPTLIANIEPSAQLAYALYDEGRRWRTATCSRPRCRFALARKSHISLTEQSKQLDKDIARRAGRRIDFQPRLRRQRLRAAIQICHPRQAAVLHVGCFPISSAEVARSRWRNSSTVAEEFDPAQHARSKQRKHSHQPDRADRTAPRASSIWCASCSATPSRRASTRSRDFEQSDNPRNM